MTLNPPIEPMLAQAREALPAPGALPGGLVMDGYRAIAFVRQGQMYLQSRRSADLSNVLSPHSVEHIAKAGSAAGGKHHPSRRQLCSAI
ncbi:hypothetical protein [Streptomyces sp. NEAU-S7GS2]|uniref:hypothetical protein n=1 Tax=Streptomyces sp. NEAU-S7GS2 TaxID=2202000 RepID=UPI0013A583C0|nr:hypothetical protein [Streptomyces sp. NEAU-S7GS2]